MKKIRYTDTLVYYDGIQVFAARDEAGGRYVGVLMDFPDGIDRYAVVEISAESLHRLRAGAPDLRRLLVKESKDGGIWRRPATTSQSRWRSRSRVGQSQTYRRRTASCWACYLSWLFSRERSQVIAFERYLAKTSLRRQLVRPLGGAYEADGHAHVRKLLARSAGLAHGRTPM